MSIWDALEKAAYTGLGLAALTKDKLDEAVDTLKKERGLTEEEGRRLAEEMKDGAEAARKKLDERVDEAVEKALAEMHLASRKELEALKARVEILESGLEPKDAAEK
ncbi:MAG: phasin family protein [Spirochaetaceae bacterium]|nr:phasin family protein [Spirochaetaceae bacterium]